MKITLVGVDCATEASKVGIAHAVTEGGRTRVIDADVAGSDEALHEDLLDRIQAAGPVLLALDAPLGWPVSMGEELPDHRAGCELSVRRNVMFRRETDRVVREEIGQRPLEVGANLIARTAHATLHRLSKLRSDSRQDLPLAWKPGQIKESSVIEVYPAATLKAHRIDSMGYKKAGAVDKRLEILSEVGKMIELPPVGPIAEKVDAVDGVICVLAAHDFLYIEVLEPDNDSLARREGWIWVKRSE